MGAFESNIFWDQGEGSNKEKVEVEANKFLIFLLVEISLHTEFQLPMLPVSDPNVCGGCARAGGLMVLLQTGLGAVRRASRPWSVFESIGTLNRRYDMVPLPTQVGRRTRTAKYDYSAICATN